MYPVLAEVRKKLHDTVGRLFNELPNLRIGIGANGDYCDLRYYGYVTKNIDLSTNVNRLQDFIRDVNSTGGGGNGGEAYELVLRNAQTAYSWTPNATKILVMIGDEVAHKPTFRDNTDRIDWRIEAEKLRQQGIQIYTIQALDRRDQNASQYYANLAEMGGGLYLRLDQFTDIVELVMGITYRQVGTDRVEQYEREVAATRMINRTLDRSFSVLAGRATNFDSVVSARYQAAATSGDLVPVSPGRFQTLIVDRDCDIRTFVESNQLPFKTGRGFYEFTKREEVQERKEVVLRDRTTGDMFCGDQARNIIGLPKGMRGKISPDKLSNYQVFIQSTSYNRKLITGTTFLYEVDTNL